MLHQNVTWVPFRWPNTIMLVDNMSARQSDVRRWMLAECQNVSWMIQS